MLLACRWWLETTFHIRMNMSSLKCILIIRSVTPYICLVPSKFIFRFASAGFQQSALGSELYPSDHFLLMVCHLKSLQSKLNSHICSLLCWFHFYILWSLSLLFNAGHNTFSHNKIYINRVFLYHIFCELSVSYVFVYFHLSDKRRLIVLYFRNAMPGCITLSLSQISHKQRPSTWGDFSWFAFGWNNIGCDEFLFQVY